MQIQYIPPPPGNRNPLQKLLALVVTAALVTLGLMFSAVLFVVVLVVVAFGGIYLWWKTREVRRQMRQMQDAVREYQTQRAAMERDMYRDDAFQGEVIEGEAVHVDIGKERP